MQSETFQFGRGPLVGEGPRARLSATAAPSADEALPGAARTADGPLLSAAPDIVAWRDAADRLVMVNFGETPAFVHPAPELPGEAELLASTDPARLAGDVALARFILLPREAVLLRLTGR